MRQELFSYTAYGVYNNLSMLIEMGYWIDAMASDTGNAYGSDSYVVVAHKLAEPVEIDGGFAVKKINNTPSRLCNYTLRSVPNTKNKFGGYR